MSSLRQFSGRIINSEATQIQNLEYLGYNCYVPGSSITIRPIGSPAGTPTSYYIPFTVISKTGTRPTEGQLIIGKYGGQTAVSCMLSYYPYTVTSVYLNTVTLFGTSQGIFGGKF